jgi:hypothetical protein
MVEQMNPVPIGLFLVLVFPSSCDRLLVEAQINRNDFVDAAVVFGIGRPHPGVLIQLKPQFQARLSDDDKRSNICDALW